MSAGARKVFNCSDNGGRVVQKRSGASVSEIRRATMVQRDMAMERRAQGAERKNYCKSAKLRKVVISDMRDTYQQLPCFLFWAFLLILPLVIHNSIRFWACYQYLRAATLGRAMILLFGIKMCLGGRGDRMDLRHWQRVVYLWYRAMPPPSGGDAAAGAWRRRRLWRERV